MTGWVGNPNTGPLASPHTLSSHTLSSHTQPSPPPTHSPHTCPPALLTHTLLTPPPSHPPPMLFRPVQELDRRRRGGGGGWWRRSERARARCLPVGGPIGHCLKKAQPVFRSARQGPSSFMEPHCAVKSGSDQLRRCVAGNLHLYSPTEAPSARPAGRFGVHCLEVELLVGGERSGPCRTGAEPRTKT
jgi:hypothetical protein